MPELTATEVAAWVEASCKRQGLTLKVTNPDALGRVAAMLAPQAGGGRTTGSREPEDVEKHREGWRETA